MLGTMGDLLPNSKIKWDALFQNLKQVSIDDFVRTNFPGDTLTLAEVTTEMDTFKSSWLTDNGGTSTSNPKYDLAVQNKALEIKYRFIDSNAVLAQRYLDPIYPTMVTELLNLGFDAEVSTNRNIVGGIDVLEKTIIIREATGSALQTQFGALLNAYNDRFGTTFELRLGDFTPSNSNLAATASVTENRIYIRTEYFLQMEPNDLRSIVNLYQHEGNHVRSNFNAQNGIRDLDQGWVTSRGLTGRYGETVYPTFSMSEIRSHLVTTLIKNSTAAALILPQVDRLASATLDLKLSLYNGLSNGSTQIVSASSLASVDAAYRNAPGIALKNNNGFVVISDVDLNGTKIDRDGTRSIVNVLAESKEFLVQSTAKTVHHLNWIGRQSLKLYNEGVLNGELKAQVDQVQGRNNEKIKTTINGLSTQSQIDLFGDRAGTVTNTAETFPDSRVARDIEVSRGPNGPVQNISAFMDHLSVIGETGVDFNSAKGANGQPPEGEVAKAFRTMDRMVYTSGPISQEVIVNLPPATEIRLATTKLNYAMAREMKVAGIAGVPLMFISAVGAYQDGKAGEFIVDSTIGLVVFTGGSAALVAAAPAAAPFVLGGVAIVFTGIALWETPQIIRSYLDPNHISPYTGKTPSQIWDMITDEVIKYTGRLGRKILDFLNPNTCVVNGCLPPIVVTPSQEQIEYDNKLAELMDNPNKPRTLEEVVFFEKALKVQIEELNESRSLVKLLVDRFEQNKTLENLEKASYEVEVYKTEHSRLVKLHGVVTKLIDKYYESQPAPTFQNSAGQTISLGDWHEFGGASLTTPGFVGSVGFYNLVDSFLNPSGVIGISSSATGPDIKQNDDGSLLFNMFDAQQSNPTASDADLLSGLCMLTNSCSPLQLILNLGVNSANLNSCIISDSCTSAPIATAIGAALTTASPAVLSQTPEIFPNVDGAQTVLDSWGVFDGFPAMQYQVGETTGLGATPAGTSINPLSSAQANKILEAARKSGRGYTVVTNSAGKPIYYVVTLPATMGGFKVKVPIL